MSVKTVLVQSLSPEPTESGSRWGRVPHLPPPTQLTHDRRVEESETVVTERRSDVGTKVFTVHMKNLKRTRPGYLSQRRISLFHPRRPSVVESRGRKSLGSKSKDEKPQCRV